MRVTQTMVANDIIANLSNTYQTLATLSNELSSGKQLTQPSDSPAGVSYAIDLQASLDVNQQYQATSQTALGWLQSGGTALQQLQTVLSRARELAVQGANDTNTPTDRQAMGAEVNQLVQQAQQVGNTAFGSSYLFAGTLTQAAPFNALGGYSGNSGAKTLQIAVGFTMQVNTNPPAIFNGQQGVFNVVQQLAQHLNGTEAPLARQNTGTEQLAVGGTGFSGTPPESYLVKVTGVSAAGAVTGASYSTDGGATWTASVSSGSPFTLNNGLTASFTNGAVPPVAGDVFGFTAGSVGATGFAVQATPNVGNATLALTGNSTGSGTPNLAFRAATLDGSNNVVGIQLSTDGGVTWGATPLTAGNYSGTALAAGTATTFALGNGLTLTWNQSTVNAATVATNQDSYTYQPTSALLGNDLSALDGIMNTVSGLQAQIGAQQNTVQNTVTALQSQALQWQSIFAHTVNADYSALATQMASAQTLYQAALAVDAKSIEPSLVQFLK